MFRRRGGAAAAKPAVVAEVASRVQPQPPPRPAAAPKDRTLTPSAAVTPAAAKPAAAPRRVALPPPSSTERSATAPVGAEARLKRKSDEMAPKTAARKKKKASKCGFTTNFNFLKIQPGDDAYELEVEVDDGSEW